MSNKQVIAIFIIGVGLLLGAFWAGLYVVKQDTAANANQNRAANQNSQNQNSQSKSAASSLTTQPPQTSSDTRYVVQVGGSFGTAEKANEFMNDLRRKYQSAHIQGPTRANEILCTEGRPQRRDARTGGIVFIKP
jgi:hypothetical protein